MPKHNLIPETSEAGSLIHFIQYFTLGCVSEPELKNLRFGQTSNYRAAWIQKCPTQYSSSSALFHKTFTYVAAHCAQQFHTHTSRVTVQTTNNESTSPPCQQSSSTHALPVAQWLASDAIFSLGCLHIWFPSFTSWERLAASCMLLNRQQICIDTQAEENTSRSQCLARNHCFWHTAVPPLCSIPSILCPSASPSVFSPHDICKVDTLLSDKMEHILI